MSISRHSYAAEDILVRTMALGFSRGHLIDSHSHSWSQLIFAPHGVMQVEALGVRWIVPPMRFLWMPANVEHTIRFISETMLRTIYIQPSTDGLPVECKVSSISPLLRELLLETIRIQMLRRTVWEQYTLSCVLLDQLKKADEMPLKLKMPTDARALRLAELLSAHPENRISLRDVARKTGAAPRTLERLFLRETGLSIGYWRRQARLVMSIKLLEEGNSVSEVAFSSGYSSPSAFVKAFREELGETPGQFVNKGRTSISSR